MKNLPWILLGASALGIGAVLVLRKKPVTLPPGPLSPELQSKVAAQIAGSKDPEFLKQLASGLHKTGATSEAMAALQKAADVTGTPQSVPGVLSLPTITVSPSTSSGTVPPVPPTRYKVVAGDIPGAIASRFSVSLSSLASANGPNKARIMGGKLNVGETLKLPAGAVDKGTASRAKGIAS